MDCEDGSRILQAVNFPNLQIPEIPLPELVLQLGARFGENRVCLIDAESKRSVAFRQVRRDSYRLAASLQQILRLGKGQRVAIALPNCLEFSVAVLGVTLCGATAGFVNPAYNARELQHVLSIIEPVAIVCMKDFIPTLQTAKLLTRLPIVAVDAEGKNENIFSLGYCLHRVTPESFMKPDINWTSDVCMMPFSSGTTGLPKGVMLTHRNVNTALLQYTQWAGDTEADVILGFLPFFHQYGCMLNLSSLALGSKLVVLSKFTLPGMLQTIQEFQVSRVPLVPPIALLLAKHPLVDQYNLKSLKRIVCSSAPLSLGIIQVLTQKHKVEIIQGYGLTEATLAVLGTPKGHNKNGSIGIVLPTFEVKVTDLSTGRALGPNQEGELWMRGPMVMKGYHRNASATGEMIDRDGWLHSGDIGYYDKDGWFYICDRIKELIKYKGMQVAPSELEAILLSHPEIADAAVIGIPNEEAGEIPKAFVVRKPGSSLTEQQVQTFVEGQVSQYKKLRGGVTFLDAIPKSASGKILRRELRSLQSRL